MAKGDMPETRQKRYPMKGEDTSPSTAIPHNTEFDLEKVYSRTRIGSWGDEQTFHVVKKGNDL
jgi:hypothetical protein